MTIPQVNNVCDYSSYNKNNLQPACPSDMIVVCMKNEKTSKIITHVYKSE